MFSRRSGGRTACLLSDNQTSAATHRDNVLAGFATAAMVRAYTDEPFRRVKRRAEHSTRQSHLAFYDRVGVFTRIIDFSVLQFLYHEGLPRNCRPLRGAAEAPPSRTFSGRLQKRDVQGNWSDAATIGIEIGQVFFPSGLAVDAAGNLYVADSGNDRVLKYTPTGGP